MLHVPTWPAISARIDADGAGVLTMNGTAHPISAGTAEDARREVVRFCAEAAQKLQRPVRVTVDEPDATWPLVVHPDGKVDAADELEAGTAPDPASPAAAPLEETDPMIQSVPGVSDAPAGPRRSSHLPLTDPATPPSLAPELEGVASETATTGAAVAESGSGAAHVETPAPAASPAPLPMPQPAPPAPGMPAAPQISPQTRRSFITPERLEEPATRGFRGALARAGIKVPPSAAERSEREDQAAVSQHWPGPRTIAVVNGKGGANKTPTTILTSAVFARYGGAGVLAWDNNQTRGTLGWRTEQGPHDATLHDLLPETERLLSTNAQSAELARYVHHQTRDHYDVLRSQPMVLASQQRVSSEDVDRIHAVAAKYYRLIVMDSGNDESDPMWLRMIDHTDQLVVATSSRAEHAEAGALLLEALAERDERSANLARNAVAVVSQSDEKATASEIRRIEDGYRELVREVVRIPYDPAMGAAQLHYRVLRPETQRAWLAAAAAIARGLGG